MGFNNLEILDNLHYIIFNNFSNFEGQNIVIKGESNFIYQITTIDNEKNLINKNISEKDYNISMIDFTECEQLLKKENGIDENISLIVLKMEKMTDKTSEKNIQYQIYEPVNLTLLNMSICKNSLIKMYIPFALGGETLNLYQDLKDSGYDLFDKNNKFYNDICTPYTSTNGTDVALSARQKYFYEEHGNLCQENCQFLNYSTENELISCGCKIVDEGIEPNNENKFNPKIIYESFYDILKYSNYKVLKCYDLVFKNKTFISNKGSIIVITYFIIYTIFLIIFIIKGTSPLKIITSKFQGNSPEISNEKKVDNNTSKKIGENNKKGKRKNNKKRSTKKSHYPPKKKVAKINFNNKNKNHSSRNKESQLTLNNSSKTNKSKTNYHSSYRNALDLKNNIKKDISVYDIKDLKDDNKEEELSNYELNNLEYEDSIKLDKRDFSEIYWSILRREHLILFTFFSCDDYNLSSVKFARFIFLVCTDMALNVFFFSDDSMNKIFLTYGKYDFIQKIPQMIYTVIVSQLLELLLCFLSLTDKYIYKIKRMRFKTFLNINNIYRIINLKLCIFFIITTILFLFYWFIISAFCAVYENTQIIFIKDSIFSFITGLLYPFILYLFPSVLRIICLKNKQRSLKFLYCLSDIIPIF